MTMTWMELLKDLCRRLSDRKCIAFIVSTWLLYGGFIDKFVWLATFGVFTGAKVFESLKQNGKDKPA